MKLVRAGTAREKARKWAGFLLTITALACDESTLETGSDDIAAGSSDTQVASQAASGRMVTLITGDKIIVRGNVHTVRPASGRTQIGFHQYSIDGHHYIIPHDAAALVASGKLDRRLFDVNLLLEYGYDDTLRADLPLIVTYGSSASSTTTARLAAAGTSAMQPLASVRGAAVRANKATAEKFWSAMLESASVNAGSKRTAAPRLTGDLATVWLDGKRKVALDRSVPQIGGDAAAQAGLTGQGVVVAVLDTGIDETHPDFAGRITEARNFTDDVDTDTNGHGTHVASILAGSGAAEEGRYRGVAPAATLLIGKVCNGDADCAESDIIAGMEWAAAQGAQVVNLSLGGPDSPELDPMEQAVNALTAQYGTLFVIAAGNSGDAETVGSPGSSEAALTVGAVDLQDQLAEFSSRGPRIGDQALKPDITAPGVGIVAARAAGTLIGELEQVGEHYARLSGTSMATPHVAGAAALLAEQHPDWAAPQLKAMLMGSARNSSELDAFAEGTGRVDLARAITQSVSAFPPSLSLATQPWPHEDDEPEQRTVIYRNTGSAAVTLRLTVDVRNLAGAPAPAEMFTVEPDLITVPAGGEAEAVFTSHTRVASPDEQLVGSLVATADEQAVHTTVAVNKDFEGYDLTIRHVAREGDPADDYFTTLVNLDERRPILLEPSDDGINVVRLRRGRRYNLQTIIFSDFTDPRYTVLLVQPVVEVAPEALNTVLLDARVAQRIEVSVPRSHAGNSKLGISYLRNHPNSNNSFIAGFSYSTDTLGLLPEFYSAHLGPPLPESELISFVDGRWSKIDSSGLFRGSPYIYNLAFRGEPGRIPTGMIRQIRSDGELARVRMEYHAPSTGRSGFNTAVPIPRELGPGPIASISFADPIPLPSTQIHYFNSEDMFWMLDVGEGSDTDLESASTQTSIESFEPGRRYRMKWNNGVLGPSLHQFPESDLSVSFNPFSAQRSGDRLEFQIPLHSESGRIGGAYATGQAALYRDGVLVEQREFGFLSLLFETFSVPAEPSLYRLEVSNTRSGLPGLSMQVNAAWTFRSEQVTGDAPAALPLMAVRFRPVLDVYNRAPAGKRFRLPVEVQRQPGALMFPLLRRLTVEVSYDGGTVWQTAPIVRTDNIDIAILDHPAQEGFVALRTTAEDWLGNIVEQTILNAYGLRLAARAGGPVGQQAREEDSDEAAPSAGALAAPRPTPSESTALVEPGPPAKPTGRR